MPNPPEIANEPVGQGFAQVRRWRTAQFWIWVALALVAAGAGLVWLIDPPANELGLRGGFKVHAHPDGQVFITDQLVGIGDVTVPWDDLLGTKGHPGLAIPSTDPGKPPSTGPIDAATLEALGGAGATVLKTEPYSSGSGGRAGGALLTVFAAKGVVIKRADGTVDHVCLWDCLITTIGGANRRVVVPVRVRYPPAGAAPALPLNASTGVTVNILPFRGGGTWLEASCRPGKPGTDDISKMAAEHGLWAPTAGGLR